MVLPDVERQVGDAGGVRGIEGERARPESVADLPDHPLDPVAGWSSNQARRTYSSSVSRSAGTIAYVPSRGRSNSAPSRSIAARSSG